MPRYQAMRMKHEANTTVTTTAGHTIRFRANEPTVVPALAVDFCLKFGAVPIARIKGTQVNLEHDDSVRGTVNRPKMPNPTDLIEEELDASVVEEEPADTADTEVFTGSENKIRVGIQKLIAERDHEDFTDDGIPKVSAVKRAVPDASGITSELRDRVWDKMIAAGDVPEDWDEEGWDE